MHYATLLGTLLLFLIPPLPPPACTVTVAPGYLHSSELSLFAARAEKDTVFVGVEPVPSSFSERSQPIVLRDAVWGQAFTIDRLMGAAERLLRQGAIEAVLVPWAYDQACEPIYWKHDSVQWVEPRVRGVFMGRLRPESFWIDGRPTFDIAFARHFPVISATPEGVRYANQQLSPDEYFDLLEFLNSFPNEDSAFRAYRSWAKEHRELVQKHPARFLYRRYWAAPPPEP